jgi:GWxTD domain-containing protein
MILDRSTWPATFGLLLLLGAPFAQSAEKSDKDDKKWPDTVRALILPDEEKTYKSLKEKDDRLEFQKIFWARRDPDLETPENEYQAEFDLRKAEADKRYGGLRGPGSATDCGRVFILFGEPDKIQKDPDAPFLAAPGQRQPEQWTFKDKQGDGQVLLSFGPVCDLPPGNEKIFPRMAEPKILRPDLGYRFEKNRLVKLVDMLPKPTPAQELLKTPREDFPIVVQIAYLKEGSGGTVLFGIVKGDASGLATEESGGKKVVRAVLAGRTVGENGKAAGFAEQTIVAPIGPNGLFVGVFKIGMVPGKYSLTAGLLDEKSGKGSAAVRAIEVPDLNTGRLTLGSVLLLSTIEELKPGESVDRTHPYGALQIGEAMFHPMAPGPLPKSSSILVFYQLYDLKVDESTAKADATVSLEITKGGKAVARAGEVTFDTTVAGRAIGPVDLAGFEPGQYSVKLRIRDNVAKLNKTHEAPFEIAP